MTREEAVKRLKLFFSGIGTALSNKTKEAFNTLILELAESEDERIRKFLVDILSSGTWRKEWPFSPADCVAYLEKQKEQPKEELVYRLNGLMQEYIKEGKDEAEKEHRFKCYQLFWDALEDENFFEPKEQKPSIFPPGLGEVRWNPISSVQQKPIDPSDDELQRHQDELYDFKVFAAKQAKEHHISFVHDFEWNNFCAEILSYFNEMQKPAEWSEEDEKMIRFYEMDYNNQIGNWSAKKVVEMRLAFKDWLCTRLKFIRPSWKPSEEELVALKHAGGILRDCGHGELAKEVFMIEGKLANLSVINKSIWKPSEEQMKALKYAAYHMLPGEEYRDVLFSLFKDLKKN